jgi:hypothetical protein
MARAAALAAQEEAAADKLSPLEEAVRSLRQGEKAPTGPAALLIEDLELGLRLHRPSSPQTRGPQTTG